jgi:nucleoid DNA-binding protein
MQNKQTVHLKIEDILAITHQRLDAKSGVGDSYNDEELLTEFFQVIKEKVSIGDTVNIHEFGSFQTHSTREGMDGKPEPKIRFRPSMDMQNIVARVFRDGGNKRLKK